MHFSEITYPYLLMASLILCGFSCNSELKKSPPTTVHEVKHKPGTFSKDTLSFTGPSIVFYGPDKLQLEVIRKQTNPTIFDGIMHEFEFQIRYCKKVLQSAKLKIPVYDVINIRYLNFQNSNYGNHLLDLNAFDDPYGVFLYNGHDQPQLADMTNFEQALHQVLSIAVKSNQ